MPLCCVTLYNFYSFYFALSTERTWFDYISLLIIPCIIYYVTNKETLTPWWMLETLRSSTFHLRMPHRCSIEFNSEDMLGQSITFTLTFFSKAVVILKVCLELLSCWNPALRPSLRREGIVLCCIMLQYMLTFMILSMKCSFPVSAALMQPQTMILPPPCLTVGKTLVFVLLSWLPPHALDTIWTK